jgi:hypothetical protein
MVEANHFKCVLIDNEDHERTVARFDQVVYELSQGNHQFVDGGVVYKNNLEAHQYPV